MSCQKNTSEARARSEAPSSASLSLQFAGLNWWGGVGGDDSSFFFDRLLSDLTNEKKRNAKMGVGVGVGVGG